MRRLTAFLCSISIELKGFGVIVRQEETFEDVPQNLKKQQWKIFDIFGLNHLGMNS